MLFKTWMFRCTWLEFNTLNTEFISICSAVLYISSHLCVCEIFSTRNNQTMIFLWMPKLLDLCTFVDCQVSLAERLPHFQMLGPVLHKFTNVWNFLRPQVQKINFSHMLAQKFCSFYCVHNFSAGNWVLQNQLCLLSTIASKLTRNKTKHCSLLSFRCGLFYKSQSCWQTSKCQSKA